ncbi:MAG: hypothetical protein ABII12_03500 [Planctomycetota bacterium]
MVDTNLLLLYGVGLFDKSLITTFKRTNKYTVADFELVSGVARKCARLITTPHILSEVSNLALGRLRDTQPKCLESFVSLIQEAHELHIEKDVILAADTFRSFGIPDAGIVELARRGGYLVLTDDFPLAGYLQSHDYPVLNLNHLRTQDWLD